MLQTKDLAIVDQIFLNKNSNKFTCIKKHMKYFCLVIPHFIA